MDASDVIASVAAGVAIVSLAVSGWAAYTAHKARVEQDQRRDRISVSVLGVAREVSVGHGLRLTVEVRVVNRGEQTEYIQEVVLVSLLPEIVDWLISRDNPEWPRPLPPRASATFNLYFTDPDTIERVQRGMLAVVYLATGDVIEGVIRLPPHAA